MSEKTMAITKDQLMFVCVEMYKMGFKSGIEGYHDSIEIVSGSIKDRLMQGADATAKETTEELTKMSLEEIMGHAPKNEENSD